MPSPTVRLWTSRLLVAAVFVAALLLVRAELESLTLGGLLGAITVLERSAILLAVALTAIAFAALVATDWLAAREGGTGLSSGRIASVAFLGWAFGLTLGSPLFGREPVRHRLYTAWGMEPAAVGGVVRGIRLTLVTGFLLLLGWGLLGLPGSPAPLGGAAEGPIPSGTPWGFLLRLLGAGFLVTGTLLLARTALPPRGGAAGIAAGRLVASLLYWTASAGALFVLLPGTSTAGFATVLGAFLLAHMAGLLSGVPAGLGVFEAALLVLLGGERLSAPILLAAVLAFRIAYHLVPFLAAAAALGVEEIRDRRETVGVALSTLRTGVSSAVPVVLSGAVFLAGAALLLTGALPVASRGVRSAEIPLPVLEASHFLGSVVGTVLLILAWGLSRRLNVAFQATRILLAVGAVLVGLRGGWLAPAAVLVLVLALLAPARREFFRPTALTREPLSPDWLLGVLMVLAATVWLGLFAYQDVALSGELWWEFTLRGDASRFLRGSVGAAGVLLAFAGTRLLRAPAPEDPEERSAITPEVEAVTEASPRADARLVYLGDKRVLLSKGRRAFIMFGVERRSWISMGDPVGDPSEFDDLVWMFRSRTYRQGVWPVFYQATPACLPVYVDAGLSLLKLGEAAVVDVQGFGLEGGKRAGMRKTVRKVERAGATFEVLPADAVVAEIPRLREISDAWLRAKGAREKSFSMGSFSGEYLTRFPHAVVRQRGRIVAFGNLWLGAEVHEFSLDLMRYDPADSPDGVMQYLFARTLLWGKEMGYRRFSLGMAPLSGLEGGPLAPLSARLGAALFRHGEHFYNFQGLRAYKEKFDPVWEPRYLASPGKLALPRILGSVATLVSGGARGAIGL